MNEEMSAYVEAMVASKPPIETAVANKDDFATVAPQVDPDVLAKQDLFLKNAGRAYDGVIGQKGLVGLLNLPGNDRS